MMQFFKRFKVSVAVALVTSGVAVARAESPLDDYQLLTYADTDGSRFVVTGLSVTDTMEFRFKYALLRCSGNCRPFATTTKDGYNTTCISCANGSTTDVLVNFMTVFGDGSTRFENVTQKEGDVVEGYMNANSARLNTVEKTLSRETTGLADATSLCLWGQNGGASARTRLYRFAVYDGGELAHYYIPCKKLSSNACGVYDAVLGVFKQATSAYTVGPTEEGYRAGASDGVECRVKVDYNDQFGTVKANGAVVNAGWVKWTEVGSDETVELTATAAENCEFVRWVGCPPHINAYAPTVAMPCGNVANLTAEFRVKRQGRSAYVQDGLRAHWDALENVGAGMYDETATTWKDLTGNGFDLGERSGSTPPYFRDYKLVFDGTPWHGCLWYGGDKVLSDNEPYTIEIVADHDLTSNSGRLGVFSAFDGIGDYTTQSHCTFALYAISKRADLQYLNTGYTSVLTSDQQTSLDGEETAKNFSLTIVRYVNKICVYYQGRLVMTKYKELETLPLKELFLGWAPDGMSGQGLKAGIYAVRFYSRPLSAEEVGVNHAVDRVRFYGCPDTRAGSGDKMQYLVTATCEEGKGAVSLDGVNFATSVSGWYDVGSRATVRLTSSDSTHAVAGWTGADGVVLDDGYSFIVRGVQTVTPTFRRAFYVATSGSDDEGDGSQAHPWATIMHAITCNATAEGDEIRVQGGTYSESVVNDPAQRGKSRLHFRGGYTTNWTRDLVNAQTIVTPPSPAPCFMTYNATSCTVDGFVFTGGTYGVVPRGDTTQGAEYPLPPVVKTVFSRCRITGNTKDGVYVSQPGADGNYLRSEPCAFASCLIAGNAGRGVYSHNGAGVWFLFSNCTITDNGGYGVCNNMYGGGRFLFDNCIVYGNADDDFCAAFDQYNATTYSCVGRVRMTGNPWKVVSCIEGTLRADPKLTDDYRLGSGSYGIGSGHDLSDVSYFPVASDIDGNEWIGGPYDQGCFKSTNPSVRPTTLLDDVYVAADGDDAATGASAETPVKTIAAGLWRLAPGGTCHLGAGTFCGNVTLSLPGMTLCGAGRDVSVVTGQVYDAILTLAGDNVKVRDLTVEGATIGISATEVHKVSCNMAVTDCLIRNCYIGVSGFGRDWLAPEMAATGPRNEIVRCIVTNCAKAVGTTYAKGYGLYFDSENETWKVSDSLFYANNIGVYDMASPNTKMNEYVHDSYVLNTAEDHHVKAYSGTSSVHTRIVNSIFDGSPKGLYNEGTSSNILENVMFNCSEQNVYSASPSKMKQNNVYEDDPLLEKEGSKRFQLSDGSPARNLGAYFPEYREDIRTDIRKVTRRLRHPDLGCYAVPRGMAVFVR